LHQDKELIIGLGAAIGILMFPFFGLLRKRQTYFQKRHAMKDSGSQWDHGAERVIQISQIDHDDDDDGDDDGNDDDDYVQQSESSSLLVGGSKSKGGYTAGKTPPDGGLGAEI
jgi:hypothetical protein